jgi:hypothetical protein
MTGTDTRSELGARFDYPTLLGSQPPDTAAHPKANHAWALRKELVAIKWIAGSSHA